MKKVKAWLDTPLKPRTRKAALIGFALGLANGYAETSRIRKLEERVAVLEAARRKELGDVK